MRGRVVKALRSLNAISVENPAFPGTPDVNFIEGWLELKWLRAWPVHKGTVVTIPHYTQQQRVWLLQRWRLGGKAFLLVQVRLEWLLFTGGQAWDVGRVPRAGLYQRAIKKWDDGLSDQDLIDVLKRRREDYDDKASDGTGTATDLAPKKKLEPGARSQTLQSNTPKILSMGEWAGRQVTQHCPV